MSTENQSGHQGIYWLHYHLQAWQHIGPGNHDNPRCHQWRQSWHHNNFWSSCHVSRKQCFLMSCGSFMSCKFSPATLTIDHHGVLNVLQLSIWYFSWRIQISYRFVFSIRHWNVIKLMKTSRNSTYWCLKPTRIMIGRISVRYSKFGGRNVNVCNLDVQW